jgi:integrase
VPAKKKETEKKTEAVLLTDAAVKSYKPHDERRIIRDLGARSLFLVIEPSGRKSWQMRFRRPNGVPGKMTLGPVFQSDAKAVKGDPQVGQPLTLVNAHLLAAKILQDRALGQDPIADHKTNKRRQRLEIANRDAGTFAVAAVDFIEQHARPKTRRWYETAALLGLRYSDGADKPETIKDGLVERWANKQVDKIDDMDVWEVIKEARKIGVPGTKARTAGRSESRPRALHAALSSMFGWLQNDRRVKTNPCLNVPRPEKDEPRDHVLSKDEIRWFWQACANLDAPDSFDTPRPFATALRLLLLTGARRDEVSDMSWSELNEDYSTWLIPGTRTKNTKPHVVPLPPLARELIAAMPNENSFVFTTTGTSPVSGWSRVKRRLDRLMLEVARQERPNASIKPWRIHDLRRTFVTHIAELGVPPHVIELIVNHISGSRAGVAGVYNRSELIVERKQALERWAAHVQGLIAARDNVVAMKKKKER